MPSGFVVNECRVPVWSDSMPSKLTFAPSLVMTVILAGAASPEPPAPFGSGSGIGSAFWSFSGCNSGWDWY